MKGRVGREIGFAQERERKGENESLFLNVSRPSALFRPRSIDPRSEASDRVLRVLVNKATRYVQVIIGFLLLCDDIELMVEASWLNGRRQAPTWESVKDPE